MASRRKLKRNKSGGEESCKMAGGLESEIESARIMASVMTSRIAVATAAKPEYLKFKASKISQKPKSGEMTAWRGGVSGC